MSSFASHGSAFSRSCLLIFFLTKVDPQKSYQSFAAWKLCLLWRFGNYIEYLHVIQRVKCEKGLFSSLLDIFFGHSEMDVKQNNAEAAHEQNAPRCSNFSIDEILKPSFGPPKRHWLSAFSPVRNGSRTISTSGLSLDLQSNRHESAFVRLSPSDSQLSVCSSPDSNPTTSSPVATSPGSDGNEKPLWPAWVFCTRYSDRPSSGI